MKAHVTFKGHGTNPRVYTITLQLTDHEAKALCDLTWFQHCTFQELLILFIEAGTSAACTLYNNRHKETT